MLFRYKEIIADPDTHIEHNIGNITRIKHTKSSKTNLKVTFPDGTVIENRFAKDTLRDVVKKVGVEKVRNIGLVQCGVPLVSTTLDNVYANAQVDLDNVLYLLTHSSTGQKRQQIENISEALGLNIVVEIV